MDDSFAFAYHHETIDSWEREQADYRELSEQMDQEWELAKDWDLPPQYSEPTSHFGDVSRLLVKDATGEIPLGKRLNKVGLGVGFAGNAIFEFIMQRCGWGFSKA